MIFKKSGLPMIKQNVLDTNVLLRFLVGDNQSQQKQAIEWFKQAENGRRKIIILPLVVAETVFVLENFYERSRSDIVEALDIFLAQKWLTIENRSVLRGLWKWYLEGFHFVDSYLLSWNDVYRGGVLTFDQRMNKKDKK